LGENYLLLDAEMKQGTAEHYLQGNRHPNARSHFIVDFVLTSRDAGVIGAHGRRGE
jgi:hypothetical protein